MFYRMCCSELGALQPSMQRVFFPFSRWRSGVRYSMLQCVAVCGSALQLLDLENLCVFRVDTLVCAAVCCSVLQCAATRALMGCSVLQCVAVVEWLQLPHAEGE